MPDIVINRHLRLLCLASGLLAQESFKDRSAVRPDIAPKPIDHLQVARKSLMITSLSVVSDPAKTRNTGSWTISSVLTKALQNSRAPGPADAIARWRDTLANDIGVGGRQRLSGHPGLPFHLLAIVNRLDLGRVGCPDDNQAVNDDTSVCGAEVRFVYGLNYAAGYHVIVELTLPKFDHVKFVAWARDWRELAKTPESQYSNKLAVLLDYAQTRAIAARVRLNVHEMSGAPWALREYRVTQYGLRKVSLGRELHSYRIYGSQSKTNSEHLEDFLKDEDQAISDSRYQLPSVLATSFATTRDFLTSPLTLFRAPRNASLREHFRHVLSVNTCTGCHGLETTNRDQSALFQHITDRASNEESMLSPFLTGAENFGRKPSTAAFYTVTPPLKDGQTAGTYNYNDLLRRHLFLNAALEWKSTWSSERFRKHMERFTAVEIH